MDWPAGTSLGDVDHIADIIRRALLATDPAMLEPDERPWWGSDEPAVDHDARAGFAAELAELKAWLGELKGANADHAASPASEEDPARSTDGDDGWLSPEDWMRRDRDWWHRGGRP